MSLLHRSDTPSNRRRRETTGGSVGSNTSSRLQTQPSKSSATWSRQQQIGGSGSDGRSITYKLEWRIDDVAELARHVEVLNSGLDSGNEGDSPSEVLKAGRQTADLMYKFDLGS